MMMNTEVFVCYVPGMLVHENSNGSWVLSNQIEILVYIYTYIVNIF